MIRYLTRVVGAAALAAALVLGPVQASAAPVSVAPHRPGCSVVYFDLGHVLIDTNDFAHLRYADGALRYLRTLRALGVPMGIITNVPSSWGSTDAERVDHLKGFIAATWEEPEAFVWSYFGDRILLPRTEAERKPAPAMFLRGLDAARPCGGVFQGETESELVAAEGVGYRVYQVGWEGRPVLMPVWEVVLGGICGSGAEH